MTVFTNPIDPKQEEDVQWVFIEELRIRDGTLMVKSERGKTYQIDLKTKAVTQAQDATTQPPKFPEAIERAITNGLLAKDYDVSFRVNPFYLHRDFDGDGTVDVAVLVTQRSTGKLGIAIIHGATDKLTIVGAGIGIGNGGDDFEWMDSWQVYPNGCVALGSVRRRFRGFTAKRFS